MRWQARERGLVVAVAVSCAAAFLLAGDVSAAKPKRQGDGKQQEVAPLPDFIGGALIGQGKDARPLKEAVEAARQDKRLAEYRRRRNRSQMTPASQLALARWCRENKLVDQERLHWRLLLQLVPFHDEAIKRLDLVKHRGMLLTKEQLTAVKAYEKRVKLVARERSSKLKQLRRAIKLGSDAERKKALQELQAIADPALFPTVMKLFANEGAESHIAIARALAAMPDGAGDGGLLRIALRSPHQMAREAAAGMLAERPRHKVVPTLVGELRAPIEMNTGIDSEISLTTGIGRATGSSRGGAPFYFTGEAEFSCSADAHWMHDHPDTTSSRPHYIYHLVNYNYDLYREQGKSGSTYRFEGQEEARESNGYVVSDTKEQAEWRARGRLDQVREEVKRRNAEAAGVNQRVHEALLRITGIESESDPFNDDSGQRVHPRFWWDWWREHDGLNNYLAAGTEVWTEMGLMPIESLRLGDRVLSRHPASGELAFRAVVRVDKKTSGALRRFEIGDRTLITTPEQQLLVPGRGWRKAMDVPAGVRLASFFRPPLINEEGAGTALEVYGLTVDRVPTFFVGQQGVLVHDATRLRPEEVFPPVANR